MADQSTLESNKSRLEKARKSLKEYQSDAKDLQSGYKKALAGVKNWEGSNYKTIVKDVNMEDKMKKWISKWGFSDDGSINGVIDRVDEEIGTIGSLLDSLFNQ